MRSLRPCAALLAVALLAGGCSMPTKRASAQSTGPSKARDRDRAGAIVVTRYDLPSGWKVQKNSKDLPNDASAEKIFNQCLKKFGAPSADGYKVTVEGKTFKKGPWAVGSTVEYAGTAADAKAILGAWGNRGLISCIQKPMRLMMARILAKDGATLISLSFKVRSQRRIADGARRLRMLVVGRGRAGTGRVVMDLVYVLKGRAGVTVMFIGAQAPVDASFQHRILARVSKRLALA